MQTIRARGETVLIADTDATVLDMLCSNLQTAGYKVIQATSGQEVLSAAVRDKPDLVIMEPVLPDIHGIEVCGQLQEGFATRQIPVMFLAVKGRGSDVLEAFSAGAYEYMTKPFAPAEVVSKVHAYFRRARRDRESNPLTGLPGGPQITAELNSRIAQTQLFAFLWADLCSFKAFNDYYGFLRGDQAILMLARAIEGSLQLLGNPNDFLGHVGGDDFVVITTPDKARAICARIIATFDEKIPSLYDEVDARKGYIQAETRQGKLMRHPLVTVSIGVVTNERRRIDSYLKASSVAAEVLRHAKSLPGSSYYFDQRENGVGLKTPVPAPSRRLATDRERAQAMKRGDFVALIAHELRTPVTAIQTSLYELLESIPEGLGPSHRDRLEMVSRRARGLAATVSELGTYSRLERGDLELSLGSTNLSELAEDVIKEFLPYADEKGITLESRVPPGMPAVTADRSKLMQILDYIVENALKFTPPGGTVTVGARVDDHGVRINVTDSGIGIQQRDLNTIFRSFSQVEAPSTRRESGLGLGLYLAKKLITGMGGSMDLRSQEGIGSTFTVSLPKTWRSGTARGRTLQDAAMAALEGVQSKLQSLRYDLPGGRGIVPTAGESIEALGSSARELELITSQAILLAEQASKQAGRQEEKYFCLRAEVLVVLESMVALIEKYRPYSQGLSRRIARRAARIGKAARLSRRDQDALHYAALLHDLGTLGMPPETFNKAEPLTDNEWEMIRSHPKAAADMFSHIRALSPAMTVVLSHHERYDGQGYPKGLKGWDIPKGATILAVATAYDAMVCGRPYRPSITAIEAREAIAAEAGRSFDPQIVEAFIQSWEAGEIDRP